MEWNIDNQVISVIVEKCCILDWCGESNVGMYTYGMSVDFFLLLLTQVIDLVELVHMKRNETALILPYIYICEKSSGLSELRNSGLPDSGTMRTSQYRLCGRYGLDGTVLTNGKGGTVS